MPANSPNIVFAVLNYTIYSTLANPTQTFFLTYKQNAQNTGHGIRNLLYYVMRIQIKDPGSEQNYFKLSVLQGNEINIITPKSAIDFSLKTKSFKGDFNADIL